MPRIELQTEIHANRIVVFDLSRSIDLHKISTKQTNEKAIAGKTHGLISLNERVTWKAKHFGIYQKLTSKITDDRPNFFVDIMVKGLLSSFRHEHHFAEIDGKTIMTDMFNYKSPLGILGIVADRLFLKSYMTNLLAKRNKILKEYAESDQWKKVIG